MKDNLSAFAVNKIEIAEKIKLLSDFFNTPICNDQEKLILNDWLP